MRVSPEPGAAAMGTLTVALSRPTYLPWLAMSDPAITTYPAAISTDMLAPAPRWATTIAPGPTTPGEA